MAKQKGIVKLRGTISGITFYKTQDGYLARESGGVDRKRIAEDPAFQRTRENAAEFGRCARSGALLIRAFRCVLGKSIDGRVHSRMTQQFFKVIQADQTSARGLRNALNGELRFLLGFEFNQRSSLLGSFFPPITTAVDLAEGTFSVTVGSFVPFDMIVAPSGATHYKIVSAGAALDFVNHTFVSTYSEESVGALHSVSTFGFQHVHSIPVNSLHSLFVLVGLVFYQEVGGNLYPLHDGSHNPFCIVEVERGV